MKVNGNTPIGCPDAGAGPSGSVHGWRVVSEARHPDLGRHMGQVGVLDRSRGAELSIGAAMVDDGPQGPSENSDIGSQ